MSDETTAPAPKRQTCTDHCGSCGRHFHGLAAFDAHRQDGTCVEPADAASEKGALLLQVWTEDGWCDIGNAHYEDGKRVSWDHPVTIWQRRPSAQAQEWLARMREERAAATSDDAGQLKMDGI